MKTVINIHKVVPSAMPLFISLGHFVPTLQVSQNPLNLDPNLGSKDENFKIMTMVYFSKFHL
jgi:hypothetical protein